MGLEKLVESPWKVLEKSLNFFAPKLWPPCPKYASAIHSIVREYADIVDRGNYVGVCLCEADNDDGDDGDIVA